MRFLPWLVILVTSIWVLVDAKSIGVRRGQDKGFADMGPWGWFLVCLGLWVVAFPLYLIKRPELKRLATEARLNPATDAPAPRRGLSVIEWIGILILLAFLALVVLAPKQKNTSMTPAKTTELPAAPSASAVSDRDTFSVWMPAEAFGKYVGTVNFEGRRVHAVQGRWKNGGAEYRLSLEVLPAGTAWYWWYGQDSMRFEQLDSEYARDGYMLRHTQSFVTPDGRRFHQGVWTKP